MVHVLNADTFDTEVLKADGLVIVDMFATWCGPCKMMAPIVDNLAEDYTDVKFCKLDVDQAPTVAARYGVQSIPTFLFFRNGELVRTLVGGRDADSFADEIDALK
ncbi:thioredoxin [Bilifractor porci]|jgi:thioredoxin 1|uniref:Thioredoxin n=1 Tax=Bilifractor porci TaxID=2606636 RepID=A0A7X2P846_9FIRM|nr:thioredoxin [Bilifractor porci]MST81886.1 thioredoxin [Bilifractor porci]